MRGVLPLFLFLLLNPLISELFHSSINVHIARYGFFVCLRHPIRLFVAVNTAERKSLPFAATTRVAVCRRSAHSCDDAAPTAPYDGRWQFLRAIRPCEEESINSFDRPRLYTCSPMFWIRCVFSLLEKLGPHNVLFVRGRRKSLHCVCSPPTTHCNTRFHMAFPEILRNLLRRP